MTPNSPKTCLSLSGTQEGCPRNFPRPLLATFAGFQMTTGPLAPPSWHVHVKDAMRSKRDEDTHYATRCFHSTRNLGNLSRDVRAGDRRGDVRAFHTHRHYVQSWMPSLADAKDRQSNTRVHAHTLIAARCGQTSFQWPRNG